LTVKVDNAWYDAAGAFAPTWLVRRWKKDPQTHPEDYDECQVKATEGMSELDIIKAAIAQGSWA